MFMWDATYKLYNGSLNDRSITVKKGTQDRRQDFTGFIKENAFTLNVNHKNELKLLGWCCIESCLPLQVYEFVSNGSLSNHIYETESNFSSNSQLLPWDSKGIVQVGLSQLQTLARSEFVQICDTMLRSYLRSKKQEPEHNFKQHEQFFLQNGAQLLEKLITSCERKYNSFRMFSLQELEKATENFDRNRRTISGADYDMYKGIHMERIIFVKRLHLQTFYLPRFTEECINEVVVLSQINHRNILKLLGCCVETKVPLLVFEFVDNGTLASHISEEYDHISRAPVQQLQWQKRLSIAIQIAEAVSYFHMAVSRPIIHNSIKSENILLDEDCNAKVINFGLSKVIPYGETHVETVVVGTVGVIDPEFFTTGKLNEKSDVYSFGRLLLELLTGRNSIDVFMEYPNMLDWYDRHESSRRVKSSQFYKGSILKDGETEQMMVCAELVLRCLKSKGEERPTMQEVVQELRLVKGSKYSEGEESSST